MLGSGSFATVYGGSYVFPVHGATSVAIKVFHGTAGDRPGRGEAAAITELMASTRVSVNAHLVQMFGAARLPTHGLCLVMELIVGQSLRIVLDDTAEVLSWELRFRWLYEIAQGMDAMHQHKPIPVLHRDLKASNVLLDSLDVCVAHARIADFGVAKAMDTLIVDTYSRGAMEWTAPETLNGIVSFSSDVYSVSILIYEVLTRAVPFHGTSSAAKSKLISMQREASAFEYDEDIFEDEGIDEEVQRARWIKKRAKTSNRRRPDLELLSADCPPLLVALMHDCWLDEAADRPTFASIVARLAPLATNSGGGGKGGGGGGGGGAKIQQQQAPKVSVYTICSDVLFQATTKLSDEGLSMEKATEIFKNDLVSAMESLFKAIVMQHNLKMPANKAPGLGTYYRTIRVEGVFDKAVVEALDKFCNQRNQVVHEEAAYSVAKIRQAALTCTNALEALKRVYAM